MKPDANPPIRVTPRGAALGRFLGVAIVLASAWLVLEVAAWLCVAWFGGAS